MKIISALLHPLLMATYSSILLFWLMPEIYSPIPYESIPYFIGAVFVTTFLIPSISILFLMLTKRISSLEITSREERSLPFLSIGMFYAITSYMFYTKMSVPHTIMIIMIMVTLLIFLIFLISFVLKISVHSAGIWGVAGLFSAFTIKYLSTAFILPLAIIFIVAGVTTASRLYLGRHTPMESWAGVLFGFFFCFSGFYWFG